MFERIEEIVELRDLISDLKLAHIYSAKLSEKKEELEELMSISYGTNLEEVQNIFNTIVRIDAEIYKNINTLNCYKTALAEIIEKLNFRKELFQQIEDYQILSPNLQDEVCKELVKVFNLYGCQYAIRRKLISLQNNKIKFISILNIIIDIYYENKKRLKSICN